jgi:hypothetical protein
LTGTSTFMVSSLSVDLRRIYQRRAQLGCR